VFREKAPELCPICKHPKAYFQTRAHNYQERKAVSLTAFHSNQKLPSHELKIWEGAINYRLSANGFLKRSSASAKNNVKNSVSGMVSQMALNPAMATQGCLTPFEHGPKNAPETNLYGRGQ
jgi:hypothetical protein